MSDAAERRHPAADRRRAGRPAGRYHDRATGRIAAIGPAAQAPPRRLLAMPALVNAHDHARPLSPTSFGAAGKPLETWLLRLAAMPRDRSLSRRARRLRPGGARRRGLGDGALHALPRGRCRRSRRRARSRAPPPTSASASTFAVFMRDRNPLVYGADEAVLAALPEPRARDVEAQFLPPDAERRGADRPRRGDRRGGREPDLRRAVRPERPAMVLGRAARAPSPSGRAHRAARPHASPGDALSARLRRPRLSRGRRRAPGGARPAVAAPDARPLRLRARQTSSTPSPPRARSSPPTRAPTCIWRAASRRSARRSGAAAASRSASTPRPSTRTTTSCAKCGSAISCTAAGASRAVVDARRMAAQDRRQRPLRQWRAGRRRARVGAPADILVLDLDRLDRDAVMPVEPIDLVFARATAAHVDETIVAGREIVRDGQARRASISTQPRRRCGRPYRERMAPARSVSRRMGRAEPAAIAHYRDALRLLLKGVWRVMPDSLPIIDCSDRRGRRRARAVAAEIGDGVPRTSASSTSSTMASISALIAHAFTQSRRFFALPLAMKQAFASRRLAATAAISAC